MKIEINILKKHLWMTIAVIVLLGAAGLVVASNYGGGASHGTLFADIITSKGASGVVTVQDDLAVTGVIYGDGSGLTNLPVQPNFCIVSTSETECPAGLVGDTYVDTNMMVCCNPGTCGDGNLDPGEECDDGNNLNNDGCSALCLVKNMAFVTKYAGPGNWKYMNYNPDDKCVQEACAAGLYNCEDYVPFISTPTINARDRILDLPYERMDGELIAHNRADFFDGSILVPINLYSDGTEAPVVVPNQITVWTGTLADGTKSAVDCLSWTSSIHADQGGYGHYQRTDQYWSGRTDNMGAGCDYPLRYFCFSRYTECGNGNVEPGEECDDGNLNNLDGCSSYCNTENLVFISHHLSRANLGDNAGADAICQAEAEDAGLSGTYKSWISGSKNPLQTFSHSTRYYTLVDGTRIADDWDDLVDGTIQNPINKHADGTGAPSSYVWTNTETTGDVSIFGACSWFTAGDATSTYFGDSTATDNKWTKYGSISCNADARIYCFAQ